MHEFDMTGSGVVAVGLVGGLLFTAVFFHPDVKRFVLCAFYQFTRRSVWELFTFLLCIGVSVQYAATKGPGSSRRLMRQLQELGGETVVFPDFVGMVYEPRVTGILPALTSVWFQAKWPLPLPSDATALEIYARQRLEEGEWYALGAVALPLTGDTLVFDVPYSELPWNWTRSSFFAIGLNSDADRDGLSDAFERVVSNTFPDIADSDGDNLPDGWEYDNALDPLSVVGDDGADGDPDGDGLTNSQELINGTQPDVLDSDCDEVPDGEEVSLGMNPLQPDTDGDGFDDGWERRYATYGFSPCIDNSQDGNVDTDPLSDPDHDGLTNAEECEWGTNPFEPDTDGDHVSDGEEIAWNSDPTDASDNGVAESRRRVWFYFGDDSYSHSEKYLLEVIPVAGPPGETTPSRFRRLNKRYGQGERRMALLKPGWKYRVKLTWASCRQPRREGWYPNYDYTLSYMCEDGGLLLDDPSGLFVEDFYGGEWYGCRRFPKLDSEANLYVLGKPRLVFDYDRNGVIDSFDMGRAEDGNTTFRFWVNDDNDAGDVNDSPNDRPESGPNHANNHVDGRCDLLDFTPVWLDLGGVFPPGTPDAVRNRVCWQIESSCLNAVWTNLSSGRAGSFRTDGAGYEFGNNMEDLVEVADVVSLVGGAQVPDMLLELIRVDPSKGVLLVEGCSEGSHLCVRGVDVADSERILIENEVGLCVTGVEKMYRYANLRGAVSDESPVVPGVPVNQWDALVCDRDIFFTHGFRVSVEDAHAWGSEVFKRLWQSGSNARFTMFTWAGDYGWPDSALYFQQNVYQALKTGVCLKSLVETVQPDATKRILMTQSLGNMVACEALRQGLYVDKYFMFNAAVATETFNANLQDGDLATRFKYVPQDWREYDSSSWTSNWYRFFVDQPGDSRGLLGWPGRFVSVLDNATMIYNYYSTGDEIFYELPNPPWVFSGVLGAASNFAWQKQETLKGRQTLVGTMYGGWGFHTWWGGEDRGDYSTSTFSAADVQRMIEEETLSENPIFNRGYLPMFAPDAADDEVKYALAKYVPAISSPAGGTAFSNSEDRDLDLNAETYRVGWVVDAARGRSWKHSDMKDVAYFYVWPLYDELVNEKGNLR